MTARPMSDKTTSSTVLGGVPYTLYSEDGVFMVKSINICDWLDHTYGDDWSKHPDYETSSKDLMVWCESNNSHYYSEGREDFFMFEAILEARVAGKDTVVVEDLS
tara:strand:- start:25 stop:339 length:315 start_codon:yes stop_codon:yes gene_type:complete